MAQFLINVMHQLACLKIIHFSWLVLEERNRLSKFSNYFIY